MLLWRKRVVNSWGMKAVLLIRQRRFPNGCQILMLSCFQFLSMSCPTYETYPYATKLDRTFWSEEWDGK